MPGWHEATRSLQESGRVQMVGIIQEQHPDRCRLFMQWKNMGWPILVDALNLLEVPYVPITVAIDEQGVVRELLGPVSAADEIEESFLDREFEPVGGENPESTPPTAPTAGPSGDDVSEWREYAHRVFLWGGRERIGDAIDGYREAVALDPDHGYTHFRLGVAQRMRYDSKGRMARDFQDAVSSWDRALRIDPNNYIWRRRIQQYGPRLDKPYPFYSWIEKAREEITERGETPVQLMVEPRGTELAERASFEAAATAGEEPDPYGRILRDRSRFIHIETAVVPSTIAPGKTARIHVTLRPNPDIKAHWNNEIENLKIWVKPPEGWQVDQRWLTMENPPSEVSNETRRLEFEVRAPEDAAPGAALLDAYALYYVCEDVDGVCLYRRQDIPLRLEVRVPER